MRAYAALLAIALIGTFAILSLSAGVYLFSSHEPLYKLLGIGLIVIGLVAILVWDRSVRYFGSRWSCFSRCRRSP